MIKKIGMLLLVVCMVFGATACKVNDDKNSDKTKLYIGNYDGGIGHAWLEEVISLFEAKYADESFEDGKTGVKVELENKKNEFVDATLMADMPGSHNDIYFTGSVTYRNFVNAGVVADMTDIVTEKWEDRGETKVSIEDKMFGELKDYLNIDGKYFGIPGFDCVYGIVYDVDLFNDEGLLDDKNGPDGIKGTYDDGLPSTWEDFKALMLKISRLGMTPFTWSGEFTTYRQRFMNSIWASYEGANDFMLNYTFSGTDSQFGKIEKTNGYVLQGQEGKKAALTVAKHIIGDPAYYSDNAMKLSQKHTFAQEEFITSVRADKRIAMILEGAWWENEAKDVFDLMSRYGQKYAYGKRNFGIMPFPKFSGTTGVADQESMTGNVLLGTGGDNLVIINSNTDKLELAKLFVKFSTSDEALAIFTRSTSTPRPYNYEIPIDELGKMTNFGKSVWNLYSEDATTILYPLHSTSLVNDNTRVFSNWAWGSTLPNATVATEPMLAFYTYGALTVDEYVSGLKTTFSLTEWNKLSNWF